MFQGKYHLQGVIGEGTYGRVYKATKGPPGKKPIDEFAYAVKMIKKGSKEAERPMVTSISTLREVKLLRELKHPNLVNLTDVLVDPLQGELALVFEYAEWTMRTIIDFHKKEKTRIPEYTIKSVMWQSLKGLQYCHENWVIHRDLKPQNMLIIGAGKHRGQVQIADLGLARIYQSPVKSLGQVDKTVVTLWYRAPELLLGSLHYTTAVDIWSVGCIFADLLLAEHQNVRALFPGKEERKEGRVSPFEKDQCGQIFSILGLPTTNNWTDVDKLPEYRNIESWQHERGYPSQSVLYQKIPLGNNVGYGSSKPGSNRSRSCLDLLGKLLELDPSKRISAKEALQHRYFTEEHPKPGMNCVDPPGGGRAVEYPIPHPKVDDDVAKRQRSFQQSKQGKSFTQQQHPQASSRHYDAQHGRYMQPVAPSRSSKSRPTGTSSGSATQQRRPPFSRSGSNMGSSGTYRPPPGRTNSGSNPGNGYHGTQKVAAGRKRDAAGYPSSSAKKRNTGY